MKIKKHQLQSDMEQLTGSKFRKECDKAVYCHPDDLIYIQSISFKILGWMSHRLESRLLGEISTTSLRSWHLVQSLQIEGGKVEAVTDFIFLGSKISVNGDCSHEIKRPLLLRRKAMSNLESVLESKDIILLQKKFI